MQNCMRTVPKAGYGEYEEKRSRFLSFVFPVSSEEDAVGILNDLSKKYWDARHHCYAYRINSETVVQRFSDDGEPSGTAGLPILEAIRKKELNNVLVVVVRYFGGILLGASGLVRAYGKAASIGLEDAGVITRKMCYQALLRIGYHLHGKIQNIAALNNFAITNTEYTDVVEIEILVEPEKKDFFINTITEASGGQAEICFLGETYADFDDNGSCIL
ncbi:MAG: YigZ family protein [Clostridiaceae bacterium]|nr:YigZ family protein [Clostridiaceae bacterium]